MIENIHLAIFIDKYQDNRHFCDLKEFATVDDLDNFTMKFADSSELRKEFDDEILEYLMENREIIDKNDTKYKHFRGRISAYYIDKRGDKQFLKLSFKKRKVIRDYLEFDKLKDALIFMRNVLCKCLEELNTRKKKAVFLDTSDLIYITNCTLNMYNYGLSLNERYYYAKYFNNPNEKNFEDCYTLMKQNITQHFREKQEYEEDVKKAYSEFSMDEFIYKANDDAPEYFKYIFDKALKENDWDKLFNEFTCEEIDLYSNYYKKGKVK